MPRSLCCSKTRLIAVLRNAETVALIYTSLLLTSVDRKADPQTLARARRRIAAHGIVIHINVDVSVARVGLQTSGDVFGSIAVAVSRSIDIQRT